MSGLTGVWRGVGHLATPLLRLWIGRRRVAGREHATRWPERFGHASVPRPAGRVIWLHAASVGESLSALPLVERLVGTAAVVVTTGTVTSADLMAARLPAGATHQFVPLDVPSAVDRFLDHWRPDAALWIESELWPGLLGALARRGVPTALVNARLSDRSFRRWSHASWAFRPLVAAFRVILARGEIDAGRFRRLGVRAETVGDMKTAAPPLPVDPSALEAARADVGGAPVWVAASLHPGEERIVADTHAALVRDHPELITILVPRHPARGVEWAGVLGCARRSAGDHPEPGTLYIADTMGELGLWFRLAPIAFVGGSLVPHGGQNPSEPARLGAAVLFGPHMGNFVETVGHLVAEGGAQTVQHGADLTRAVARLLDDPEHRERMRLGATHAAQTEARVIDRVMERLAPVLSVAQSSPSATAVSRNGLAG